MCLKTKVDILSVSMTDVVLVENIVQALIQVLHVEDDSSTTSLHANLDLVDVVANLEWAENPIKNYVSALLKTTIIPVYTLYPSGNCSQRE